MQEDLFLHDQFLSQSNKSSVGPNRSSNAMARDFLAHNNQAVNGQQPGVGDNSKAQCYFLNKVVVVTGASSGIGRCLAYWYLNNGAKVALVGKDIFELETIGKQFPSQALVIQCDLTEDTQMHDMKEAIAQKLGSVDVLINCAGVIFSGCLDSTYPQDYDHLFDLNLRAPFVLTQFFLEFLRESKGCVINISCDQGSRPEPGIMSYCMAKAGLEMMTKASAMELAPFGIRVNAVAPTFVDTHMYLYTGLSKAENEALANRVAKTNPMGRNCTEVEAAKAVIFLSSEFSHKTTGQILRVDGGKTLTSKGQSHWYGWQNMNRKFYAEETTSYLNSTLNQEKIRPKPSNKEDLEDWIDDLQTSQWATKDDDAHRKVLSGYRNKQEDQNRLKYAHDAHQPSGVYNPMQAKRGLPAKPQ